MLIVKRSPRYIAKGNGKDTILIADGLIRIVVKQIQGQEVSIAIHCPKDISIIKGEINANATTGKRGNPNAEEAD